MFDTLNPIKQRLDIALLLDQLGWLSETVYMCVDYSFTRKAYKYTIGKHLVSNEQYQRFVEAADFSDEALWRNVYSVDCVEAFYSMQDESILWMKTRDGDGRYPGTWNDARFGSVRRGLPVVGISWFEAMHIATG